MPIGTRQNSTRYWTDYAAQQSYQEWLGTWYGHYIKA